MSAIATAVMVALYSSPAAAAAADMASASADSDEGELGVITVTAQRREESVTSVPMSIQAFSGEQLNSLRVTDVNDLTSVVPGFSVVQSSQGIPNYYLRGIGFNTFNLSASSPVGTYVDEVAYAYPLMNSGPMYDLERVEVLKGPQGTLFGRNTTAGLIDFVTGKPTKDFAARVTAEGGNYGTYNFEGMVNGSLSDRVQARFAFRTEDSSAGWQKSLTRDESVGAVRKYGARLSIAAQPTDALLVDFSYNFWLNKSDTQVGQMIAFAPAANPVTGTYRNYNAPGLVDFFNSHPITSADQADWAPYSKRATAIGTINTPGYGPSIGGPLAEHTPFHGLKLKLDQNLGNQMHLISLTGFNKLNHDAVVDYSGAPYELLVQQTNGSIRSINEELRLEGKTERVNWTVGGYYGKDNIYDSAITLKDDQASAGGVRNSTAALLNQPINTFGYTRDTLAHAFRAYRDYGNFDTSTASIFANADWKIAEPFSVTTGVRYTRDKQHYSGCDADYEGSLVPILNLFNRNNWSKLPSSNGVPPAPVDINGCNTYDPAKNAFGLFNSQINESNVSWRVAGNWTPTNTLLVFASVSQGAKNADTPVNPTTIVTQDVPAKQERLLAYELGAKAHVFENRIQANGSFFYYDYHDKQAVANFKDPVYLVLTQLSNIPKSRAYGFDGDLSWRLFRPLTASVAGTWVKAEVQDWNTISNSGQPVNLAGQNFAYTPRFTGTATVQFDQPINHHLGVIADVNSRYQSESNATSQGDPLYKINAYGLLNANLGLYSSKDQWKVSVWGRNLTDRYYWTQVVSNSNTIVRFAGHTRTFGLSVSKEF